MRLTIVGGGGFRVPLLYRALLAEADEHRRTDLVLFDVDSGRIEAIRAVLAQLAVRHPNPPAVRSTTDLDEALEGADFVLSAIRVGGLEGRARDERVALAEGLLGQETVGAGGVLYGLRTVPVAMALARRIADRAPNAWLINFTNPAGMITEAMARVLGDRVIGICDSPAGLCRRVAGALGVSHARAHFDYVGLNHLGWLRAVLVDGHDRLPGLLADDAALCSFEEGQLFGPTWLRTLGAVPNEYLHYYYFTREAVAALSTRPQTRGELILHQQGQFYATVAQHPEHALREWTRVRRLREETYLAENRAAAGLGDREAHELDGGGYEQVALATLRSISDNAPSTLILNVRNRSAVPELGPDVVVEVPCVVDANGARPLACPALTHHQAGLVHAVKEVEQATIEAALSGSRAAALRALALHPLVDSVRAAERMLDAWQADDSQNLRC